MVVDPVGNDGVREIINAHIGHTLATLQALDVAVLRDAVDLLRHVRQHRGTVWTVGNGGSAALAAHLALGLSYNATREHGAVVRAICLCADAAAITALANDFGQREVFSQQVALHAAPQDCLFIISNSGRSDNVVQAARTARDLSIPTIAMVGSGTSPLAGVASLVLDLDAPTAAVFEDVAMVAAHAIYGYFMATPQ